MTNLETIQQIADGIKRLPDNISFADYLLMEYDFTDGSFIDTVFEKLDALYISKSCCCRNESEVLIHCYTCLKPVIDQIIAEETAKEEA